jgi:hypothetical protein
MQNIPDEGQEVELFETSGSAGPDEKETPEKENVLHFWTILKRWFNPRTA